MFGSDLLYTAINVTDITDLLDTVDSVKGLFNARLIPEFFTGDNVINFYMTSPYSGNDEYNNYRYNINCRAKTDSESRAIAMAVFTQLNRADFIGYHTNIEVLGTLPPMDDTDVFNTPISVVLKSRI